MIASWMGVFPAVVTHFTNDGSLDISALLKHLDAQRAAGVHGFVLLGTLGENSSLDPAEKLTVLSAAAKHLAGSVPLLAGVAETSTRAACQFAAAAADVGVDGLMVLPALSYKADAREAAAHFRAVAAASDRPIMIYNNPVTYGVDLTPELLDELGDEPRFVAVKESSDDIRRITDIRNRCGNRYQLFCGVDDIALEAVLLGADGWLAGLVNAFPHETMQIWNHVRAGQVADALTIYRWFMPLLHLDAHVKLVQYIKLAVQECGIGSETVRPPRLPLVGAERDNVLRIVRSAMRKRPNG